MRPRAASPTGTAIGAPVSTISIPRIAPSVDDIATARTMLRPMCCCTSATSRIRSPASVLASSSSALYNSGSVSDSKATSSTGPMTWTILPVVRPAVAVAILLSVRPALLSARQRRRAADDLRDLLRDPRLPRAVVGPPEDVEHLPRVVGRVLHRRPPRRLLGGRRLDERTVDGVAHVGGQQLAEYRLGRREQ